MINANLYDGASVSALAKLFGINRKAITKHIKGKHPGTAKPLDQRSQTSSADDTDRTLPDPDPTPEGRLRGLISRLESDMQMQSGPLRPELARELRMAYTELAKISQATPDAVKLQDVEGLPELLKDLFLALEPFPDARAAMADILRSRMEID